MTNIEKSCEWINVTAKLKPAVSTESLALKWGLSVDEINKLLDAGQKIEREHTNSDAEARQIASHHIDEDKDYYLKLRRCVEAGSVYNTTSIIRICAGCIPFHLLGTIGPVDQALLDKVMKEQQETCTLSAATRKELEDAGVGVSHGLCSDFVSLSEEDRDKAVQKVEEFRAKHRPVKSSCTCHTDSWITLPQPMTNKPIQVTANEDKSAGQAITSEHPVDTITIAFHESLFDYYLKTDDTPENYYITEIAGMKVGFGSKYQLKKFLLKLKTEVFSGGVIPTANIRVEPIPHVDSPVVRRLGGVDRKPGKVQDMAEKNPKKTGTEMTGELDVNWVHTTGEQDSNHIMSGQPQGPMV